MIRYVFRDGPLVIRNAKKADPQKIGEAIAKARQEAGSGDVRETVIAHARSTRHPIHKHLEWDDALAGHKYRLEQVNDLIRIISVIDDDGKTEPAFISIVQAKGRRQFWTPDEVRSSVDLQTATLLAAERDLLAFEKRYRTLSDICEDVREIREKVRARREATESRSEAA